MDNVMDFKNALMREFIRLCRGNDFNKLSLLTIGETVDKVLEAHYRNFPIEDAPAVNPLPCKIGDTAWVICNHKGHKKPKKGVVSEMYYTDDMRLHIVVKFVKRGEWGKDVFGTQEEAWEAIGGRQ